MSSYTEPERTALGAASPARLPVAGGVAATAAVVRLRALLSIGLSLAVVAALLVASVVPSDTADPDLARLLGAMGWIKGGIVLAAAGILWVRFGWPVATGAAIAYLLAVAAAAFAATMIAKLAYVGPSALLFHLAALTTIVVAAVEGRSVSRGGEYR